VLVVEAADDVSQGATKGNSGIVHAGYDDTPNTNRAKFCWAGNQMFAKLDSELNFGFQRNGSLVVATSEEEESHLHELLERGHINGEYACQCTHSRLVAKCDSHLNRKLCRFRRGKFENHRPGRTARNGALHQPESNCSMFAVSRRSCFVGDVNPLCRLLQALYSPDAGNLIPFEYTVALAENAVDNGSFTPFSETRFSRLNPAIAVVNRCDSDAPCRCRTANSP